MKIVRIHSNRIHRLKWKELERPGPIMKNAVNESHVVTILLMNHTAN